MLTMNEDFQPGVTDYFINQNPKLREFSIAADAKTFTCDTNNIPTIYAVLKDTITIYTAITFWCYYKSHLRFRYCRRKNQYYLPTMPSIKRNISY